MKVILTGATGYVGEGVLLAMLAQERIEKVLSIGRRPCGHTHAKLEAWDIIRWLSIDFNIPSEGTHTVKVVMIDPEIVVEKLIINPDNEHPTYHGKE